MIEEVYVSFETAKLLKEKGFDEGCYWWYEKDTLDPIRSNDDYGVQSNSEHISEDFVCALPTQQMAMVWLREVYDIYYDIQLLLGDKAEKYGDLQLGVYRLKSSGAYEWKCWLYADTYKELYEKYIKYCLENLI